MKLRSYPFRVVAVIIVVALFAWLDYRRNGDLIGLASWTIVPIVVIFLTIAIYMRVRYRKLFQYISNNEAAFICSNQARLPDLPESTGSWPTGRLFVAEGSTTGFDLRDSNGVTATIPRDQVKEIVSEDVEFFSLTDVLAISIKMVSGAVLPLIPTSRVIPGSFAPRKRVRMIASKIAAILNR